MEKPGVEPFRDVVRAAERGARFLAGRRRDVIEEAKNKVTLYWQLRVAGGRVPIDPNAWAYQLGTASAYRMLREGSKRVELTPTISETLSDFSEESTLIDRIEKADVLRKLTEIVAEVIGKKADEIDRRIFELHYKRHEGFSDIASEIGIAEGSVRRRWSRLITTLAYDVAEIVRNDDRLAPTFSLVLEDVDLFRSAIFGLLSVSQVAARKASVGLAVLERALETFGSREEAVRWLHDTCPALSARPIDLIATSRGRRNVENVLACIDHGMIY